MQSVPLARLEHTTGVEQCNYMLSLRLPVTRYRAGGDGRFTASPFQEALLDHMERCAAQLPLHPHQPPRPTTCHDRTHTHRAFDTHRRFQQRSTRPIDAADISPGPLTAPLRPFSAACASGEGTRLGSS